MNRQKCHITSPILLNVRESACAGSFAWKEYAGKEAAMTEKQKRFCDEYLIDCNGTRAYKAAYQNVKKDTVAATAAGRMLRNVEVQKYLSEQMEALHNERTADQQEIVEYLTSVLRGESKAEVIVVEGIGDGCSEARRVIKRPDEKDRLRAAELLGKRYGMWTEKVQVGGLAEEQSKLSEILEQRKERRHESRTEV